MASPQIPFAKTENISTEEAALFNPKNDLILPKTCPLLNVHTNSIDSLPAFSF